MGSCFLGNDVPCVSVTIMVDMYHNQKEATGTGSAQKLPSFAIFLSLSTPDETEPVTEYERVSPNTTGTLAPSSNMVRFFSYCCLHLPCMLASIYRDFL